MRQKRAEMTIGSGPQMFNGQFANGDNYSMSQLSQSDNNSNASEKTSDMVS